MHTAEATSIQFDLGALSGSETTNPKVTMGQIKYLNTTIVRAGIRFSRCLIANQQNIPTEYAKATIKVKNIATVDQQLLDF
jgi:hypothetical protein